MRLLYLKNLLLLARGYLAFALLIGYFLYSTKIFSEAPQKDDLVVYFSTLAIGFIIAGLFESINTVRNFLRNRKIVLTIFNSKGQPYNIILSIDSLKNFQSEFENQMPGEEK
ncbi:hypothetical protein GGE65_006612 [Skermanella aerolata]|uniref:hypothetical protein n=1 Tax=Skermanella aerolata TaxID=393310 RepID=UPI003D1F8430